MLELVIYMVIMAITPGPNTILSLANASEKGFWKGISLNFGMLFGVFIITSISYILISFLFSSFPTIQPYLQALGCLYILYLAFYILRKGDVSVVPGGGGFKVGLMLQLVNMKVMLLSVTAISSFIIPMKYPFIYSYLITLLIPTCCFLCGLVWAAFGGIIAPLYSKHRRAMNIVFCFSLLILAFISLKDILQKN